MRFCKIFDVEKIALLFSLPIERDRPLFQGGFDKIGHSMRLWIVILFWTKGIEIAKHGDIDAITFMIGMKKMFEGKFCCAIRIDWKFWIIFFNRALFWCSIDSSSRRIDDLLNAQCSHRF